MRGDSRPSNFCSPEGGGPVSFFSGNSDARGIDKETDQINQSSFENSDKRAFFSNAS